jgi:hypothetical protein
VKRIASLSLLLLFLNTNTELHQLLKLPMLLGHYIDHKKNDAAISLFEFVSQHYGKEAGHTDKAHEKLPFKSSDCGVVHAAMACSNAIHYNFKIVIQAQVKSLALYAESAPLNTIQNSIWQPPKLV